MEAGPPRPGDNRSNCVTYLGTGILDSMKAAGLTETLTFRPQGGSDVSVSGLVERPGRDPLNGVAVPMFRVLLSRDSSNGITADAINPSADRIVIPEHRGGTGIVRHVVRVTDETPDTLVIEAQ